MKKYIVLTLTTLWACSLSAKTLEYEHATIKLVPPVSKNTAGFITIKNLSDKDLKLIKVESEISEIVELHTMKMDKEMMVMRPVDSILVPKKGSVHLKPGGLHIMFLGIKKALVKDDKIEAKLIYEDGFIEKVLFLVKDSNLHSK